MYKIGVLGTANIAERRMIPAIHASSNFEYIGVAISEALDEKISKAERFVDTFGGDYSVGYDSLLKREDIDAVYIPLPPALHYRWAKEAIKSGKHVFLEKPMTTKLANSAELVELAKNNGLALTENYGFCYHGQIGVIKKAISNGYIGDLRLIRASFGFPHREASDFRYSKELGGGALLDCGGYTVKIASLFLGQNVKVVSSSLVRTDSHEVDVFGSASLEDDQGLCAQVSFGMDNHYKCELEIWGSKGYIIAPRIFTAPAGFEAPVTIENQDGKKSVSVSDDQFLLALDKFNECISSETVRQEEYGSVIEQSRLVEDCVKKANYRN